MEPQQSKPEGDEPLFHAPFQEPVPGQPVVSDGPTPEEPATDKPPISKLLLGIGIAAAVELIVIIGLAVAVASKSDTPTANGQNGKANSSQGEGPTAANSTSVQLIDDSISQDLSTLNDDKDFPADKFSDRSLNL